MTLGETMGRGRKTPAPHPSILILGVGNILFSDEGVGVHVIEAMQEKTIPANVELLDGGTASTDLIDCLSNRDKVIIVDAVQGKNEPGTLYRFTPADIKVQRDLHTSVHQIDLLEALTMAEYLGGVPQNIVIYGIEPKNLGWGLELSPEIKAVVPRVIELVLSEL